MLYSILKQDLAGGVENEGADVLWHVGRWTDSLHEWLVISHTWVQPGSKPGLSLTPSLPQDKQYKGEKNILGSFGNTSQLQWQRRPTEQYSKGRELGARPLLRPPAPRPGAKALLLDIPRQVQKHMFCYRSSLSCNISKWGSLPQTVKK